MVWKYRKTSPPRTSQYWPHVDIAVLRSGYGSACQEIEFACQVFFNLQDAIAWGPKAVIIATPATDHLSKALAFAKLKIPLFIEKPVGSGLESLEDWNSLLNLAKDLPVLVGYVLRHDPCAVYIKIFGQKTR